MNTQIIKTALDIRTRVKDFDIVVVFNYLKNLNQTDPILANTLNNPTGWEECWNKISKQ